MRSELRKLLKDLAETLAQEHGMPPERVVYEIKLWAQSANPYRVNPTPAEKRKSYDAHNGCCHRCKCSKDSFDAFEYHHIKRGIAYQHQPHNMVPMCSECHKLECHSPKSASPKHKV